MTRQGLVDSAPQSSAGLPASENYIGHVGGQGVTIDSALTVTLPAYVAGDCVAGLTELANVARVSGGHAILQALTLWDRDDQEEPFDVFLFKEQPTSSTFTDANPVVLHADDRDKQIPGSPFRIYAGDYIAAQSGGSGAAKRNIGAAVEVTATSVWVALQAVDTPDYTNTDALTLMTDWLQD